MILMENFSKIIIKYINVIQILLFHIKMMNATYFLIIIMNFLIKKNIVIKQF